MINCILKVKINDFFPKIDAIPYKDLIFIIKYNNSYSKIKVIEKDIQFFQHSLQIQNNTDLKLKIKLIDYMKNNILLGSCDLLIPYQKINQMIGNIFLSYRQQVQLKVNPSLKIKLLNKTLIISNIYLDLGIEITSLDNNKIFNNKKIGYSKTPIITKTKNFYNNGLCRTNDNLSRKNNNKNNNMDISYSVINNNYLNYIATDNNNYFINCNIKPSSNVKIQSPDEYILENNKRFSSNIKPNKLLYSDFKDEKKYRHTTNINKNILKRFIKTPHMTEVTNSFENNMKNNGQNNKIKEIIGDKYINNNIKNDDNILFNKQEKKLFCNRNNNKIMSLSPSYFQKTNYNKDVSQFASNISQTFGKSRNPKKNKGTSISSVLNYFNYVKPFKTKSVKIINLKENINSNNNVQNNLDNNNSNEIIDENKNESNNNDYLENYNQIDLKEKIIKLMNDNILLSKEIKQKTKIYTYLINKYFLSKEQYYSELKKKSILTNNYNNNEVRKIIHVNINSKLNESFYSNIKKIKNNELFIIDKIFHNNKSVQDQKKIKAKLEQQKNFFILLNIIRDLIKNYDNISQIYNDDENKKILFKSLLLRYGIREKEENKEKTLLQIYNDLKQSEKNEIIFGNKKREIEKDIYKSIIHEEESEDAGSSISGRKSRPNNILKKLSWCSEDSVIKEKENIEKNNRENDEINFKISLNNTDGKRNELLIEEENGIGNNNEENNNL